MTVRELINALEDKEVVIAEYQNYGSDWAYEPDFVDAGTYSDFDKDNYDEDDDEPNCVRIVLGRQIGTMQDDLW